MKKTLLIAMCMVLCLCKKKEEPSPPAPAPAPPVDPYTYSSDIESSRRISFMVWCLADMHLLGGYPMERYFDEGEYHRVPGSGSQANEVQMLIDISDKRALAYFNNTQSRDGRNRNGSLKLFYGYDPVLNPDATTSEAYSEPGFSAQLTTQDFKIDNWSVSSAGAHIKNLNTAPFDPINDNFVWELTGTHTFTNEFLDTVIIKGTVTIVLLNSGDTAVFKPGGRIRWKKAELIYACDLNGTMNGESFSIKSHDSSPLFRNQTCAAQLDGITPAPTLYHPFVSGLLTFSLGNFHPRTVQFGLDKGCDNVGTVSFNGEEHVVAFK